MAKASRGSTAPKSVSAETPRKLVPSLDHLVTQWMSQGTSSKGSSANSSQDQSVGSATMPSMRRRHSSVDTSGVGPAVRTGKPDSAYWPGGSRSASSAGVRRRPLNPRETKPFTPLSSHHRLGARERRVAPFHERRRPLEEVLAAPERVLELRLEIELHVEVAVDRLVEGALGAGVGAGWARREAFDEGVRLVHQRLVRVYPVHETPLQCLGRGHPLSQKRHLERACLPDGRRDKGRG